MAVAIFVAALRKRNTTLLMFWVSWIVIFGAYLTHLHIRLSLAVISHQSSEWILRDIFSYTCGYLIRTSVLLYAASFFTFINQSLSMRDFRSAFRVMLLVVVLLSLDILMLAMVLPRFGN